MIDLYFTVKLFSHLVLTKLNLWVKQRKLVVINTNRKSPKLDPLIAYDMSSSNARVYDYVKQVLRVVVLDFDFSPIKRFYLENKTLNKNFVGL